MKRLIRKAAKIDFSKYTIEQLENSDLIDIDTLANYINDYINDYFGENELRYMIAYTLNIMYPNTDIDKFREQLEVHYFNAFMKFIEFDNYFWEKLATTLNKDAILSEYNCDFKVYIYKLIQKYDSSNGFDADSVVYKTMFSFKQWLNENVNSIRNLFDDCLQDVEQLYENVEKNDTEEDINNTRENNIDRLNEIYYNALQDFSEEDSNDKPEDDSNDDSDQKKSENNIDTSVEDNDIDTENNRDDNDDSGAEADKPKPSWTVEELISNFYGEESLKEIIDERIIEYDVLTVNKALIKLISKELLDALDPEDFKKSKEDCIDKCVDTLDSDYSLKAIIQLRNDVIESTSGKRDPLIDSILQAYGLQPEDFSINCNLYNSLNTYINNYLQISGSQNINNIKSQIAVGLYNLSNDNDFDQIYKDKRKDFAEQESQSETEVSQKSDEKAQILNINNFSLETLLNEYPRFNQFLKQAFSDVLNKVLVPAQRKTFIDNICKSVTDNLKGQIKKNKDISSKEFFQQFQEEFYRLIKNTDVVRAWLAQALRKKKIDSSNRPNYEAISRYLLSIFFKENNIEIENFIPYCPITHYLNLYLCDNLLTNIMNNININANIILNNLISQQNDPKSIFNKFLDKSKLNNIKGIDKKYFTFNTIDNKNVNIVELKTTNNTGQNSDQLGIAVNADTWTFKELTEHVQEQELNDIITDQFNETNFLYNQTCKQYFIRKMQEECCKTLKDNKFSTTNELYASARNFYQNCSAELILKIRNDALTENGKTDVIPIQVIKNCNLIINNNEKLIQELKIYINNNSDKFNFDKIVKNESYIEANLIDAGNKSNIQYLTYFPQLFPDGFNEVTLNKSNFLSIIPKSKSEIDKIIQEQCNIIDIFLPKSKQSEFKRELIKSLININMKDPIVRSAQKQKNGSELWEELKNNLKLIREKKSIGNISYNNKIIVARDNIFGGKASTDDVLLKQITHKLIPKLTSYSINDFVKNLYNYIFDSSMGRTFRFDKLAENIFTYIGISETTVRNDVKEFWEAVQIKYNAITRKNAADKDNIQYPIFPDMPKEYYPKDTDEIKYNRNNDESPQGQTDSSEDLKIKEITVDDIAREQISNLSLEEFKEFLNKENQDLSSIVDSLGIQAFLPEELFSIYIDGLVHTVYTNISPDKRFNNKKELIDKLNLILQKTDYLNLRENLLKSKFNTTGITNPLLYALIQYIKEHYSENQNEIKFSPNSKLYKALNQYTKKIDYTKIINETIIPQFFKQTDNKYLKKLFDRIKNKESVDITPDINADNNLNSNEDINIDQNDNTNENISKSIEEKPKKNKGKIEKVILDNLTVKEFIDKYGLINLEQEIIKAAIGCIESEQGYSNSSGTGYKAIFKSLFEEAFKNNGANTDKLRENILNQVELHNIILHNINNFRKMCRILAFNLSDNKYKYIIADPDDINSNFISYIRKTLASSKVTDILKQRLFAAYKKYKKYYIEENNNSQTYENSFPAITEAISINDSRGDVNQFIAKNFMAKEKVIITNNNIYTGNLSSSYTDILYNLPIDNEFKNLNNCACGFITGNNCIFLYNLYNFREGDVISAVRNSNINIIKVYLTIQKDGPIVTERRIAKQKRLMKKIYG